MNLSLRLHIVVSIQVAEWIVGPQLNVTVTAEETSKRKDSEVTKTP